MLLVLTQERANVCERVWVVLEVGTSGSAGDSSAEEVTSEDAFLCDWALVNAYSLRRTLKALNRSLQQKVQWVEGSFEAVGSESVDEVAAILAHSFVFVAL